MTLSNMFSPVKKQDKELLLEIGSMIETLVRLRASPANTTKALDLAEKFGQNYLDLSEKIKTHDYTREDQSYFRSEELFKKIFK